MAGTEIYTRQHADDCRFLLAGNPARFWDNLSNLLSRSTNYE